MNKKNELKDYERKRGDDSDNSLDNGGPNSKVL